MNRLTTEDKIEHQVLANQTHLVQELLLKNNPDWIEKTENLYDESSEAVEEYLTYETDIDEDTWIELDVFECHDLTIQNGFEPSPHEILEWWLITDWLAYMISQFEEPVLATDYGAWWGRTTTGQAIRLDAVMRKIVDTAG